MYIISTFNVHVYYTCIYNFIDPNLEIIYDTPVDNNTTEGNFCEKNEAYNALDISRQNPNEIAIYENS